MGFVATMSSLSMRKPTKAESNISASSTSVCIAFCASIIENPRPELVAMNSAQITLIQPPPTASLAPVNISGSEPGKMTWRNTLILFAPILLAALK